MTTPHAGNPFLQAVLANPDDDLTRLVYADWLDENGQPERAEFIRVQVALAAGEPDLKRRQHLEDRQRDLLMAHDFEWVGELAEVLKCPPGEWGGWVFRRGFVEYFHLPSRVIVQHGATFSQLTPVRELYLNPATSTDVYDLCSHSWLACVRDLYLIMSAEHPAGLRGAGVLQLVHCPYLAGLNKLVVSQFHESVNDEQLARFEARFRGIWHR